MEYLLVLGITQAIFLGIILIVQKPISLPNRLLIVWMLILAINLMGAYLGVVGFYRSNPQLFGYDTTLILLHGPLLFIYVQLSISEIPKLKWSYLVHFLPYLFFTLYLQYKLKVELGNPDYEQIKSMLYNPGLILYLLEISIHLLIIVYVIASLLVMHKYRIGVQHRYSFTEGIDLKWLKQILIAFVFISTFIVISIFLSDFLNYVPVELKGLLFYALLSLLPFYLFYHAIRRTIIYPSTFEDAVKYSHSNLSDSDSATILKQLNEIMQKEKPFLDGHLTITKLASMLDQQAKSVSQVINEHYKINFFNYINHLRVDEVKTRFENPAYQHFTLLGIALDCGFNSKSAFNSTFKKITGVTPSEFKKSIK